MGNFNIIRWNLLGLFLLGFLNVSAKKDIPLQNTTEKARLNYFVEYFQEMERVVQETLLEGLVEESTESDFSVTTLAAWQITVNRIDFSPQPSGSQILFRMQLQCAAVDENAAYNSEVRFPAQSPTYFQLPVTHPAIESFYYDTGTAEWVIDLQDVVFAGTSIEFDILAKSPNHTTPDGTTFQIDATITSDNTVAVADTDSGTWSATANLGVEKYLQYGPDSDALLDAPVRYYLYPCDPSFTPNTTGHLYLANWVLIDELPTDVVYNNSSGTYDAGIHTVTWSDVEYLNNEDCDFAGASDYWIEVTFPSTVYGAAAMPPVLEAENIVTFEGYPLGEAVMPANRLFDTDTIRHSFGLPNPIGTHTKSASTPFLGSQDKTYEGEDADFFINIRTASAGTVPYYWKIIDPLPCLDYTPNVATQYESQLPSSPACGNPAYQPSESINLYMDSRYVTIEDKDAFAINNPTIPLEYIGTDGSHDTLQVPHAVTGFYNIEYEISWAEVLNQIPSGVGIAKLIWDSESIGVFVGVTAENLRTAARMTLRGDVAADTPTYPMLNAYRVRNYAYFYIDDGTTEDSLGFIQDDVEIIDAYPILRAQKSVGETSGLITLTANSAGADFRDNDSLIITDLLPFGYTFNSEAQQYMQLGGTGSWSWSTSNGDTNGTPYSELDDISVRNYIDVEVIDDYNGTGRQLVRATYIKPPIASGWEGLQAFRFSFYLNQSTMNYSAVNSMEVFPTSSISATELQCQSTFSSSPTAASSNDPNDLDGDGLTIGDAFCADTDNVTPPSAIVELQSYKAVKGDAPTATNFEPFPTVAGITVSGGSADFQINIKNTGSVGLENFVIYDLLPHIGDIGLTETQVGVARGSQFNAIFDGIDIATLPTGTVVEYSTSTTPCRDELTTGATPFPTGCVNDWTTILPASISDVKALRFTFPSDSLFEFIPGEAVAIEYAVTYPSGVLVGEIGWNNFAYAGDRMDDNSAILPTEPPKVGIGIPIVDLSVTKSVDKTSTFVGSPIEYTLLIDHEGTVTEGGDYTLPAGTAKNIVLNDNFKTAGLKIVPGSITIAHTTSGLENGVTFDTMTGNITIPELGPNDAYTITYSAYSDTEQSITNTLEVMSHLGVDDSDSTPGNGITAEDDIDSATAAWVAPAISLKKLVESQSGSGTYIEADATDGLTGVYTIGQPVNYRFIIENTGSTWLSNVTLEDNLTGFACDQTIGYMPIGDIKTIDCTWSYGFVEANAPYVNIATVSGTHTISGVTDTVSAVDSASIIVVPNCSVDIVAVFADNCQASGNDYIADWNISIAAFDYFTNAIAYQRNSDAVQSHTLTGTMDTLTISSIPADGGIYDTLKVWFTNDMTCVDTMILKRPVPCPLPINPLADCSANAVPITITEQICDGDIAWLNLSNIQVDDATFAKTTANLTFSLPNSNCLEFTNFGFNIPATATITGVNVSIRRKGESNNSTVDKAIQLLTGGAAIGNDKASTDLWSNTSVTAIYGGQYDLWGATLTPADVNATNFGFTFQAARQAGTGEAHIEYVEMSICYTDVAITEAGGQVYEDWNFDGVQDGNETSGVQGVQVLAYNCDNNLVGTTYTDIYGNYKFTGLTAGEKYRIEFHLPEAVACWAKPTQSGANNGTTVQFVEAGNLASLGLINLADYCQENPQLISACFTRGDIATNGSELAILSSFDSEAKNTGTAADAFSTTHNINIPLSDVGSIWGLAYAKNCDNIFAAATIKTQTEVASDGIGAIYMIDNSTNTNEIGGTNTVTAANLWLDLEAPAIGLNLGDNPYDTEPYTDGFNRAAYAAVGKAGIGDIDVAEDGTALYATNLYNRTLLEIPIGANCAAPTSGSAIKEILLPTPASCTDVIRPWAVKVNKGKVYVGMVCTGEQSIENNDDRTGIDRAVLIAYVYEYDPIAGAFGESPVLEFPLNYDRTWSGSGLPAAWYPWFDRFVWDMYFTQIRSGTDNYTAGYAQPILSDIEFDGCNMVIGLLDRAGIQFGYGPPPSDELANGTIQVGYPAGTTNILVYPSGDLLIAGANADGTWTIEDNGNITSICGNKATLNGDPQDLRNSLPEPHKSATGAGPGGDEFFWGDYYGSGHGEVTIGALAIRQSSNEIISMAWDPLQHVASEFGIGGAMWLNTNTGAYEKGIKLYENNVLSFQKGSGFGDVELICGEAPIEIGNYVWKDTDGDGIQDACESGIDSVTVELLKGATLIASTKTINTGQYYFSNKNALDAHLVWSGTGADTVLLANTTYTIRISNAEGGSQQDSLNNLVLTTTDAISNTLNTIDNDAILIGTNAEITATTEDYGCVNHNFDFGFKPVANYDYGDLPDIADGTTGIRDYETYDSTGGPSHLIIAGLFFGDTVDVDTDGQPDTLAVGDDTKDGYDDEDGITISSSLNASPGGTIRLPLTVTNTTGDTAYVEAWIDWNGDGDFDIVNELVADLKDNKDGVFPAYLMISIPPTAITGSLLGFRVRLSNTDNMTPYGRVNSGEVEDYLLGIACPQAICLPTAIELRQE